VTRAQAAAAFGGVRKLEHITEHTPGGGGGVTWLKQCTVHFQGGAVDIVFGGGDRESLDEERRGLTELGNVKIVRGLAKAAYLFSRDPDRHELHVFHPSAYMPGHGEFALFPVGGVSVPVKSLIALSRAVARHPYVPLKKPKQ